MAVVRDNNVDGSSSCRARADAKQIRRLADDWKDFLHLGFGAVWLVQRGDGAEGVLVPETIHCVAAPPSRRLVLRLVLGVGFSAAELHASLRRAEHWTVANQSYQRALLDLLRDSPHCRNRPILRAFPRRKTSNHRRRASVDFPHLPAAGHWPNGWHNGPQPAALQRTSYVGRRSDAARTRLDRGPNDVCHVHATAHDKLAAGALDTPRHVRLRGTGRVHCRGFDLARHPSA